jgi:hypothetical protein
LAVAVQDIDSGYFPHSTDGSSACGAEDAVKLTDFWRATADEDGHYCFAVAL